MLLSAFLCFGCANPGPPKPPSLHLPAIVKDLAARRSGILVHLTWTTPSRTTDDMDIKGPMTAEICREVGARPLSPAARASACAPVQRIPVNAGPSEIDDTLPGELQGGSVVLLTYRLQIYNSVGRSAGESASAYAAAGPVPPAVEALRATASEHGAVLEWQPAANPPDGSGSTDFVDLFRTDLSAPGVDNRQKQAASAAPRKTKPSQTDKGSAEAPKQVHLRVTGKGIAASGTVDATATMGETYSYVAERVRQVTIGNHALELRSSPSPAVSLAMTDIFPPKIPVGLAAISGSITPQAEPGHIGSTPAPAPYVDLSWEPNAEADLAGYRVYRQLARPDGSPQGPLARLTALPVTAPAYRDLAVKPGQGYIYTVTAVDAAGNESAPSAKALETLSPEDRQSPH